MLPGTCRRSFTSVTTHWPLSTGDVGFWILSEEIFLGLASHQIGQPLELDAISGIAQHPGSLFANRNGTVSAHRFVGYFCNRNGNRWHFLFDSGGLLLWSAANLHRGCSFWLRGFGFGDAIMRHVCEEFLLLVDAGELVPQAGHNHGGFWQAG